MRFPLPRLREYNPWIARHGFPSPTGEKITSEAYRNAVFGFLIFMFLFLFGMSWIVELNFHYWQGFMPGVVSDEVFGKMEAVIASTSTILMVMSFVVLGVAYYFKKRR